MKTSYKLFLQKLLILSMIALFFFVLMTGCIKDKQSSLIPLPAKIEYAAGRFHHEPDLRICYAAAELEKPAVLIREILKEHGVASTVIRYNESFTTDKKDIKLRLQNKAEIHPEGYILQITRDGIDLKASSPAGIFYGIQTIKQLVIQSPLNTISIPSQTITDFPRFAWRGMHLDVSRHFMPKEFIKQYIDYLAFLKMNVFHWHLVDDQGWRIEIKQYPLLTDKGAFRKETLVGHYSDSPQKYDGTRYGGFYTQEDIREIVFYAQERFITIVPEIEIPGHSQAAIAAYPELGCTDDTVEVRTIWGISPYIYNAEESTFMFLQNVLDEVIDLFPSKYIHIGGDEALKDQWESSENVQNKMKTLGIANEQKLQKYFIGRIEEYLLNKGRNIIGWDEILEGGLAPTAAVMSWRGTKGGIEAAKHGHYVVMTPTDYCYFDYYQSKDTDEPLAIGGYLPVKKVYSYEPVPIELSEDEAQYILGVQGNVWTEYIKTPEKVEYMIFPRIFAMSEIQWTLPENKNYKDFVKRVRSFEAYLQSKEINYATHIFRE
ncbi:MAG: beta-N-acetylhexosaminidase [Bacteroidales bacterium]|nr:beta-N-acetylhexosaminidase [Bacteroidales bacterium]